MSIAKMQKVSILSEIVDKRDLLTTIQRLGIVHIKERGAESGENLDVYKKEKDTLLNAKNTILAYYDEKTEKKQTKKEHKNKKSAQSKPVVNIEKTELIEKAEEVLQKKDRLLKLKEDKTTLEHLLSYFSTFDNVSENAVKQIEEYEHLPLHLVKCDAKAIKKGALKDTDYVLLKGSKNGLVLIIGDEIPSVCKPYEMKGKDIADVKAELWKIDEENASLQKEISAYSYIIPLVDTVCQDLDKHIEFEGYFESIGTDKNIVYLTGFIPNDKVNQFKKALNEKGTFSYIIESAEEDEATPTLVKTNKYTGMLTPVLDILGTYPGYHEKDISFWFLSFFAVFFALIIGDAAYGLIIFAIGLYLFFKGGRKFTNTNSLVMLLGGITLVWGALTGTWFGSDKILRSLPFLQKLVVPQLATFSEEFFGVPGSVTQNAMMRISFSLGAMQLCLACVLNVIEKSKTKDLSLFADVGWFSSLLSLYFLALMLVVGQTVNTKLVLIGVIFGFLLVLLFNAQGPGVPFGQGIKKSLAGAFTTFLDTISAFGNVMSYIRLFAVGIASVAISESFNGLAEPLLNGALIPLGLIVLVIGHTLNFVLGLLSVVVHGVRLNVMEFSSQCNVEWTGIEYKPFTL